MRRRAIITAAAALTGLAALVWAPGAMALGLTDLSAAPTNVAAGAHSDFQVHIGLTQATDDIKDLTIHLPPGMVGDPTGPAVCSIEDLNADSCPDESQVGTSSSQANLLDLVPLTVSGEIFNVTAQEGEPARFGIVLHPPIGSAIVLQSAAELRQDDFGLDTVLNDLPNTANGLPITITSLDITLFGTANGQPFMRNPTSCSEKTVSFEATSYAANQGEPVTGSAPSFTPTNCDQLPFSPDLTAKIGAPGLTDTATHPPLTTVIEQDETEAGLKRAQVILPNSIQPNTVFPGLCTEAQFAADNCPAASDIGSVQASSPLLSDPLVGDPYMLVLDNDGGFGVGVKLQGQLSLKLKGKFVFDETLRTGNLFDNLPDIPISHFELTVNGGPNGILYAARDLCDPPDSVLDATYDGHNGAHLTQQSTATIEGCAASDPTASIQLHKPKSKKPELDLDVEAGSEAVELVKLKVPKRYGFAKGKTFTDGAEATVDGSDAGDDILTPKRRKVIIDPPGADDSVTLHVGDGAMRRLAGGGKTFKVKVIDAEDQAFSFPLKP